MYSANSQYQRRIVCSMMVFMGVFSFSWYFHIFQCRKGSHRRFFSNGAIHISHLLPDIDANTLHMIYAYSVRLRGTSISAISAISVIILNLKEDQIAVTPLIGLLFTIVLRPFRNEQRLSEGL